MALNQLVGKFINVCVPEKVQQLNDTEVKLFASLNAKLGPTVPSMQMMPYDDFLRLLNWERLLPISLIMHCWLQWVFQYNANAIIKKVL